ncbi:uncharacterized protein LOC116265003 isoform X2 [Nymphaea colorata]|uniref:uncharacterized protein LOC116265003 isoform X2 n=1 Tax=Nymphaea colorata TaxID=210225 RepID=UPI00214F44D9|nr:uncharacterized protein LOC116265003 isoform X2 [Nymphaea colorata]
MLMVFPRKDAPSDAKPRQGGSIRPPSSAAGEDGGRRIDGDDSSGTMVALLADAGCTLCTSLSSPFPFILPDVNAFQRRLEKLLSSSSSSQPPNNVLSAFLSGFSSYIQNPLNFKRALRVSASCGNSLVRILLLVPPLQLPLQNLLLGKMPEFFVSDCEALTDDVARLIVDQFRWLDFLVDPRAFSDKLLQVLSICPYSLKKDIIGSLPEILGDQNHEEVISTLERMLLEDSELLVPVLESFSNLNLDSQLQEQVVTIALSCIRTVSADHLPHLLRFLLLSATPANAKRIISHVRKHVIFGGTIDCRACKNKKLTGKSAAVNAEALVYEALRSSLRFRNVRSSRLFGSLSACLFVGCPLDSILQVICETILKELKCIDKAHDYKALDVWLLILIFSNRGSQSKAKKVMKKKIVDGLLRETLFGQCIYGNRHLVQDCFSSFVSIGEFLLACKEQNAREFGVYIYITLFEEFLDRFSRDQILGSLIMHIGSGLSFEVNSALETLVLLSSKYSQELISNCSQIYGILDYLEGFNEDNLHKVYELFSHLALSVRSNAISDTSGIANELLMIIRKQVSNPDWHYKRMGIIGTLKVVSLLGDSNASTCMSTSVKPNSDEALDLLRIAFHSCKESPLLSILLYDQLALVLHGTNLQPLIMEWMYELVGEFESEFIHDLEGGQPSTNVQKSGDLQGEMWMNLDGDLSPICLNILSLLSSSERKSATLQFLPAKFLLLSIVVKLTNHGSLGDIDALLGCPLYLPSTKYFKGTVWKSLSGKEKQTICLSLYYSINWIRELLNSFSTQVSIKEDFLSRVASVGTTSKLLMRLRNLVLLEHVLESCLQLHPLSLPEMNCLIKHSPTSGVEVSQDFSSILAKGDSAEELSLLDICSEPKVLDAQRHKLRPLFVNSLSILSLSKKHETHCPGSTAELPLHLYLLRDLHFKLDCLSCRSEHPLCSSTKGYEAPDGLNHMSFTEFLKEIRPLFPCLRKHLETAIYVLRQGTAQAPTSTSSIAMSICKEILYCYSKVLSLPDIYSQLNSPILKDLLDAFRISGTTDDILFSIRSSPSYGNIDYAFCDDYSFFYSLADIACSSSFSLASEVLVALQSIVNSIQMFIDKLSEGIRKNYIGFVMGILPTLQDKLGALARRLLEYDWDCQFHDGDWRSSGKMLQKILHIHITNAQPVQGLLSELACTILPQVPSYKAKNKQDSVDGLPTLCPATLVTWYHELHEENLRVLNKLLKEVGLLQNSKTINKEMVATLLGQIQVSVDIVVSLVSMCKTHDKLNIHVMAIKYGGKFVDSFLKVFDFLQIHFVVHNAVIIQMIKELQRATRTIQTLCSEAKVSRRIMITSKIPYTKRMMERFLFNVKGLFHSTSNGCSFWMGNLKHKDLSGQVVNSQAYDDNEDGNNTQTPFSQMAADSEDVRGSQGLQET